jgi:hypothetical protein
MATWPLFASSIHLTASQHPSRRKGVGLLGSPHRFLHKPKTDTIERIMPGSFLSALDQVIHAARSSSVDNHIVNLLFLHQKPLKYHCFKDYSVSDEFA